MNASSKCPHPEFTYEVKIVAFEETTLKYTELQIVCKHCNQPAQFRGMPAGLSPMQPMTCIEAQEVRLPFLVAGDEPPTGGVGFSINAGSGT